MTSAIEIINQKYESQLMPLTSRIDSLTSDINRLANSYEQSSFMLTDYSIRQDLEQYYILLGQNLLIAFDLKQAIDEREVLKSKLQNILISKETDLKLINYQSHDEYNSLVPYRVKEIFTEFEKNKHLRREDLKYIVATILKLLIIGLLIWIIILIIKKQ